MYIYRAVDGTLVPKTGSRRGGTETAMNIQTGNPTMPHKDATAISDIETFHEAAQQAGWLRESIKILDVIGYTAPQPVKPSPEVYVSTFGTTA